MDEQNLNDLFPTSYGVKGNDETLIIKESIYAA